MAERVYLHIGAPKTGTTFLQEVLRKNRDPLASKGIWYVGERWTDHVHARLALIEHPRLNQLDPAARDGWRRAVDEVTDWPGHTAIMSHELFGSATAEQARRAIADLAPAEVHLVFTTRNFVDQVVAVWQEQVKWGGTTPLSQWWPGPGTTGPHSDWSWRTMDPVAVLGRWQGDLDRDHIHVVTVPKSTAAPHELWERFATACDIPADMCDLDVSRPNKSLGVVEAELLRRVNVKLGDAMSDRADIGRWVRGFLAHGLLVPRDGSRPVLPEQRVRELVERAADARARLTAAGYDVVGDLADIEGVADDRAGTPPDDVNAEALLEAATDTIASMLVTVRHRTEQRDRARERLTTARSSLATLRARPVGLLSRLDGALFRVRDQVRGWARRRRGKTRH